MRVQKAGALRAKLTDQPAQEPCGGKKGAVLLREQCFFCSLLYALPLECRDREREQRRKPAQPTLGRVAGRSASASLPTLSSLSAGEEQERQLDLCSVCFRLGKRHTGQRAGAPTGWEVTTVVVQKVTSGCGERRFRRPGNRLEGEREKQPLDLE